MAAGGALISLVGTVFGVIGGMQQAKATEKAEDARKQQMNLEAMRRRRETIRQAAVARSQAISSATAQGAGETSALQGGIAQVQGQANRNIQATNQDQALGNKVFEANKEFSRGAGMIALGNGISSLGGMVTSNWGTMQRIGVLGAPA